MINGIISIFYFVYTGMTDVQKFTGFVLVPYRSILID